LRPRGGRAIDGGRGRQDDNRLSRGRKHRGDGRALEARVQAQHDHRRGHLRAGVAGRDEGVGMAIGLQAENDAKPSYWHWAESLTPTSIELFGLPRTAAAGLSVIAIVSAASTISSRLRWAATAGSSLACASAARSTV